LQYKNVGCNKKQIGSARNFCTDKRICKRDTYQPENIRLRFFHKKRRTLLFSLATCFCNDIYREAAKKILPYQALMLKSTGDFAAEGEPVQILNTLLTLFQIHLQMEDLIDHTNKVAEIHNTLRKGPNITLVR